MRQDQFREEVSSSGTHVRVAEEWIADRIEEIQLVRLAGAVLTKSPLDLAALAEANPMIVWEWVEAFRRQKLEAEAEVRFWSAAMAALSTATPNGVRTAAE